MVKKFYVVDQNYMRSKELVEFMVTNPTVRFVIPDTGLLEMVKSEKWEETFRRSFELFVPVVTRCYMSMAVQEARDIEFKQRVSINGRLLPRDFTKLLRDAIIESQSGKGPTMSLLRGRMTEVQQDLMSNELNALTNREELKRLVKILCSMLSKKQIKACRQEGREGLLARRFIAQSVGEAFYFAYMVDIGASVSLSRRLWKTKSMTRRWCCMVVHHALQWLGDGGLDNAKDKVLLNDTLDQDYVLIGSFFDGILSLEKDVQNASLDLQAMLVQPPTDNVSIKTF